MWTPYADDVGILLPRKGKFTTGRSKPYIFASPQELEKVIVPSCPGLPVLPPMLHCILDGHVKPD
jgi:hypothetical protein